MKNVIKIAIIPVLLLVFALAVKGGTHDTDEIKKVMDDQEAAWNRGDIDAFMLGYWKSDKVKFVSKNGVTYGWQNVLDKYKKSYPDKATMGTLKFSLISIESLGKESFHVIGMPADKDKAYMVTGKWMLTETEKSAEGYFTLIFKKIDGHWVIVSDHTS